MIHNFLFFSLLSDVVKEAVNPDSAVEVKEASPEPVVKKEERPKERPREREKDSRRDRPRHRSRTRSRSRRRHRSRSRSGPLNICAFLFFFFGYVSHIVLGNLCAYCICVGTYNFDIEDCFGLVQVLLSPPEAQPPQTHVPAPQKPP